MILICTSARTVPWEKDNLGGVWTI